MKKLIAMLLALVMVLGLVACGQKAPAADAPAADAPAADAPAADAPAADAPAADDGLTIAFVPKVIGQAWWDYVGEGVAEWAAEHPEIEVIYKGPAEVDAAAQVQIMTDLVNQGIDVLCFAANDPNACEEICKQAMEKGIIVISTESATMTNIHYDVEAFTDAGLGAFLMDSLARQMGEEGEYITMVGSMTMESHNNWADAAVARAEEAYPKMTLVADARISSDSDAEVAYNRTKEMIQKYPNLKGILGTSSFDAPGAARAIDELGLTGKVFAISVAMPSETRDYLKSGVLTAVGLWDPAVTAKCMLNLAVDMLNGVEIAEGHNLGEVGYESVQIDGTLMIGNGALEITAENVDTFTF